MKRRHTKYWTLTRWYTKYWTIARWQAEMDQHEKSLRIYRQRVAAGLGTNHRNHVPGRLLATSKLRNKR